MVKDITQKKTESKVDQKIILQDESQSSRQMSRKLSTQTNASNLQQANVLSEQERTKIIQQKVQDIRDDFFATYLASYTSPEEQKKAKKNIPWHESMTVTSDKSVKLDQNGFNDDIQREIQFYNLTLENVQRAIGYLTQENIPIQRPADYEVEMFKSPQQVIRIDNNLVKQQKRVKNVQEKRLREQGKRLSKMIKSKKMREEHKEKKQNQLIIEDWKKEIREKGSDKAGDLNNFIKQRQLQPKKRLNQKKLKEGGKRVRPDNAIQKRMFKKGIKQPKSKRPGKDTRMRNKSHKQSMKDVRRE